MQTPKKNPKTFLKQSTIKPFILLPTIIILSLLPKLINARSKAFNPQAVGTIGKDISYEYFNEDLQFLKLMKILSFDNLRVRSENSQKLKKEFQVRELSRILIIIGFFSFWISSRLPRITIIIL